MGRKRHTNTQVRHRHGHTQGYKKVSIHSPSGLHCLIYPPLIQKRMQVRLWRDDVHQASLCSPSTFIRECGSGTHITYLYRSIWQCCTLNSHHIYSSHNSVYVCGWGHTKCNLSHGCTVSMPLELYLQAASTDLRPCEVKNVTMFQKTHSCCLCLSNIHVVHIISDPGDNGNIFTCILFCSGKSLCKTKPKFLQAQRGIKESFNKISGEFSWLIVCFCFAITERDTPSAITASPIWRAEDRDCSVHTPAGCRSEQDPRSCLDSLTVWPHHLTKIKTAYRYIPANTSPNYTSRLSLKIHYAKQSPPPTSH